MDKIKITTKIQPITDLKLDKLKKMTGKSKGQLIDEAIKKMKVGA